MKRYSLSLVLGLITGTVFASSAGWAQEAAVPATPLKTASTASQDQEGKSQPAKPAEPEIDIGAIFREISGKLRSGDFKAAYAIIGELKKNKEFPSVLRTSLQGQLLNALANKTDYKELDKLAVGKEYFEDAIDTTVKEPGNPAFLTQIGEMAAKSISEVDGHQAALAYLDTQSDRAKSLINDENKSWAASLPSMIQLVSLNPALGLRETAEIDAIYEKEISKLRDQLNDSGDMSAANPLMSYWMSRLASGSETQQAEVTQQITQFADSLLAGEVDSEKLQFFMTANSLLSSRMRSTQPRQAKELLNTAIEKIQDKTLSDSKLEPIAKNIVSRLSQMAESLDASIRQQEMIGQPAPELDAEHWVNGNAVSLADLKGKVVLLDFWAVWCGPCIATFPELRKWNEEFSDQGLVILGVTGRYGFVWDEESKSATSSEQGEDLPVEEELSMLEKFMASYELPHPTLVTPKMSQMDKEYAVTGIPHVALLDKQGNVALVQVGSGPESAKRIHDKIQELLAQ